MIIYFADISKQVLRRFDAGRKMLNAEYCIHDATKRDTRNKPL